MTPFQYAVARAAHRAYFESAGRFEDRGKDFEELEPNQQRRWLAVAMAVFERVVDAIEQGSIV